MRHIVKLIVIAVIVVPLFSTPSYAQSFAKRKKIIQTGLALGLYGRYGPTTLPPLNVCFQYGIHDLVSIGGIFGIAGSKYGTAGYYWRYTYILLAARGEFHPFNLPQFPHFALKDKLDAYGGLTMGVGIATVKEPDDYQGTYNAGSSYFLWGMLIGARYYFTDFFGVYTEFGWGVGVLNLGVAFKF